MTNTDRSTLEQLRAGYRRDYDPYADSTISEHLGELADRREKLPVSYSARGNGCWVLTEYDDISALLRRNNRGVISYPNEPDGINAVGTREKQIPIEVDGPEHRQYRQLLDPIFAPKRVAELADELELQANKLIDEFIEDGTCDFVQGFALPFPGATVMAIMGWPLEDLRRMNAWVDVLLHGVRGASPDEVAQARGAAQQEFVAYMMEKLPQWRAAPPAETVTSVILDAEINGAKLTDEQVLDFFVLMMAAGLDTVQSVLAQSMAYFARNPGQWDKMFETPENLAPAIEELLRWTTPPVPTRTVTDESLEIHGVAIPKGERVHAPLAAGNRDPKYYPEPDEIKFDREPKPHLAFGVGPHRCVGLHLARLELKIAYTELRRRMPKFELDPAKPAPREHLGLAWGVDDVHLKFAPGKREHEDPR